MAKGVKNPSQLTEFEEHFVDLYVINWTAFYYILRTKYAGPKEFAEKLIIKTAFFSKGIEVISFDVFFCSCL